MPEGFFGFLSGVCIVLLVDLEQAFHGLAENPASDLDAVVRIVYEDLVEEQLIEAAADFGRRLPGSS